MNKFCVLKNVFFFYSEHVSLLGFFYLYTFLLGMLGKLLIKPVE